MKNQFSDEKLDLILKSMVDDARLSDEAVDEIADSPQLWWGVKRNIAGQMPARSDGWIPTFDWRIAAFASLLIAVFLGFAMIRNSGESLTIAEVRALSMVSIDRLGSANKVAERSVAPDPALRAVKSSSIRPAKRRAADPVRRHEGVLKSNTEPTEVKSEFIALMYSPEQESGQIVMVKVPRSMMVSLGVTTNVQNNSEFVKAEVLMGEDGSARAIRFVQ
jgi:hypothetical protein